MKKKDNIDYQYIIGADIETSRVKPDEGEDIQVPFLTNTREMDIETGKFTQSIFHRTIREWIGYLNEISSEDRMRIVYCHNLFYEMTFIIREFKASFVQLDEDEVNAYGLTGVDGIMRSTTDVVYARLDCCPNIIFRDSLALFNKSLNEMGKDLSKRLGNDEFSKLEYDYDAVRMPWDDLTEHDYKYNERDNEVVLMSLYYFLHDRDITMKECPLTSTADTKRARKEYILKNYGEDHLKQINRTKHHSIDMYDFYSLVRGSYQGGFTGANYKFIDKMVKDVYSVDIKSSYPYQMVSNRFPVYDEDSTSCFFDEEANDFYFDYLHGINHNQLQQSGNPSEVKGYYAFVEFEKVKIRNDKYLLDLAYSHCYEPSEEIDVKNKMLIINGKIKEADHLLIYMNNVDMDRFLMLYDYDNLIVHELWVTTRSRRLPEGEIGFILNNFSIKESIDKNKEPIQYSLAKIRINAMYGVKVQNEVKDFTNIQNGVISKIDFSHLETGKYEDVTLSKEDVYENTIGKGNKKNGFKGSNFDIYSDGVYIASFARTMLMTMMVKLVEADFDVIYSDTDSLKFKSNKPKPKKTNKKDSKSVNLSAHNKVINLISEINSNIIKSNTENLRIQQFLKNNTNFNENKIYALGTWEIESVDENENVKPYSFFKTLGAKKYAYIDDKGLHTTVAGCRKETFARAITNYANKLKGKETLSQALDYLFTTGTLVDVTASGRTTARYETRSFEECNKLTYNGRLIGSAGGVIIEPTTYKLNISKNDSLVLGEVERFEEWTKSINIDGEIKYNEEDLWEVV
jgi:hypothetical protein